MRPPRLHPAKHFLSDRPLQFCPHSGTGLLGSHSRMRLNQPEAPVWKREETPGFVSVNDRLLVSPCRPPRTAAETSVNSRVTISPARSEGEETPTSPPVLQTAPDVSPLQTSQHALCPDSQNFSGGVKHKGENVIFSFIFGLLTS